MADRKRVKEQAIAESVELSKPPVSKPKAKTPAEKLKSFTLNAREKAEAKAPMHPRASKGQAVRSKGLEKGIKEGREQAAKRTATGRAKVARGEGIIGAETKVVPGFKDDIKKVNVRQIKKGKRQVINSGKVALNTDYRNLGSVKQYKEQTAGQSKFAKMTPQEREAARAEAERKFLRRPKEKAAPKTKKPKKKSPTSLRYRGE